MNQAEALKRLATEPTCRAADASARVPQRPGYYAIFVDDAKRLPDVYRDVLLERTTKLIYLGIAKERSLRERLCKEDLSGKGASTVFRAIGSILGYRPTAAAGGKSASKNYKFSAADKAAIVCWIDAHLWVNWVEADTADKATETAMIQLHRPLLNTAKNPERLTALASLRTECRRIALSCERSEQ